MNKRTKHNLDGLGLSAPQKEKLIQDWVCSRRDREILKLKFLDDLGYEEIASIMHLSTTQTKSISYKRIDELRYICLNSI